MVLAIAVASRAVPVAVRWWNRPAAAQPLPRFTLYWTADGQRMQNGQWAAFPLTDGSAVTAGDRLRLAFSTGSDGFAYVVTRDALGGVSVLFPGAAVRGASRVRRGEAHEAPADGRWFTVDARAGLAAIYLIAGHDPLENLEELTEDGDGSLPPGARMELLQIHRLGPARREADRSASARSHADGAGNCGRPCARPAAVSLARRARWRRGRRPTSARGPDRPGKRRGGATPRAVRPELTDARHRE